MSDEMRVVFDSFDTDGSGFLDKNELRNAFKNFKGGLADSEIDALIAAGDTNGDGKISFDEFAALIKKVS